MGAELGGYFSVKDGASCGADGHRCADQSMWHELERKAPRMTPIDPVLSHDY